MPENIENYLSSEIKKIKELLVEMKEKGLVYSRYIESLLREIFCYTMSDLLTGYTQYLTFMDDIPLFNCEGFVANKFKEHKKFYSDFTSTQIFRQFLQNDSKENFPFFYKILNQNKMNISHNVRYSNYIPKTATPDISKFHHIRSCSNNLDAVKIKLDSAQTNSGNDSNNSNITATNQIGYRERESKIVDNKSKSKKLFCFWKFYLIF